MFYRKKELGTIISYILLSEILFLVHGPSPLHMP